MIGLSQIKTIQRQINSIIILLSWNVYFNYGKSFVENSCSSNSLKSLRIEEKKYVYTIVYSQ